MTHTRNHFIRPFLRWLASLTLLLALAGCGGGAGTQSATPQTAAVYVGTIEGTDALIAVAPEGNLVVAYVCAEKTWAERTGWFFTELENNAELTGTVKRALSGTGHTLENTTITETQVKGTVRFADGSIHAFTAERADPQTTAGLYESHASEGQAGLIVTNDGRAAGAVRLISGTTTTPPTAAPITVNQSLNSGTSSGGIAVTIPSLGSRTLQPVRPRQTAVDRAGPTLFILVHGMNHPVEGKPENVDTPAQSRGEWHLDFIQGLLGGRDPGEQSHVPMFNFTGQSITPANFLDPSMLPVFDSFAEEAEIKDLDSVAAHFVTLDSGVRDVTGEWTPARKTPMFSAFITYRDAAGGLVESGKRIANETYLAIRWYEVHFRLTPKIVYVAQSFGGVTARFVLSNPSQSVLDARGTPALNPDRILLTPEDSRRMDYVRDRIMYMVTLGTPHEGSFMADIFTPLQQTLLALESSLDNGVAGLETRFQPLGAMLGQIPSLAASVLMPRQTPAQTLANVRAGLAEARRKLNGRALRDLTHAYWERANKEPLHPDRARRTAASPIVGAGRQLIPIYAAGARTPGGRAFTAPELAAFDRLQAENPKEQGWMTSTMVTDLLIHTLRADQDGFGRSTQGIFAGFDGLLDRRERIVDGPALARTAAADIARSVSPWFAEEFGAGVEGITKFVMGNARLIALPVYLDRKGEFKLNGSIVLPVPAFQCTAETGEVFRIKLEFGQLLTLMRSTYGSLRAAANGLTTLNLNGVLGALSATGNNVTDILGWFLREYFALNVPSGRCKLGEIDLSSPINAVLSAVNIRNWAVVEGTDTFPAPRWEFGTRLASDDEIDDDGVVGFESAVGFSLGTSTPLFFDHTRADASGARGSWYRIFDSPVERESHGMQHQWNIGHWVLQNFAMAGPLPGAGDLSVFP